jgi:SAM-dependent methyltransferase
MPEVDRSAVKRYWEGVTPSILGPYMMDGFGFPNSAGDFRFRRESQVVRRLLDGVDRSGAVLDLGSGVGYWAEEFARTFSHVIAVEGSSALFSGLQQRCDPYSNIRAVHDNVLSFEPEGTCSVVFLGGLLMYLGEADVKALLRKLVPHLGPGGVILCRESTVRGQAVTGQGDYPVIYRPVSDYKTIFENCGLSVQTVERNEPYVLMQMGCELIKKWKDLVPESRQALGVVGPLVYSMLRLGSPWLSYVPRVLELPFPRLENHFFVLEASSS